MSRVLVACEFSGVVRRAFRERGHDAWSCDLLPAEDGSPYHIQGDVLEVLHGWHQPIIRTPLSTPDQGFIGNWDLMIAHPPCTYLSVSGMHWTNRGLRDPKLTEDALAFVKSLMAAPIPRKCIENPVSIISSRIRKPDQIIQPWYFGHDASKKTCLWLENLPILKETNRLPGDDKTRRANQTSSGQNKLGPSADRWKLRSVTYPNIAAAMAEQWGKP